MKPEREREREYLGTRRRYNADSSGSSRADQDSRAQHKRTSLLWSGPIPRDLFHHFSSFWRRVLALVGSAPGQCSELLMDDIKLPDLNCQ